MTAANSASEQGRNRSIGFDASYPNTTTQDELNPASNGSDSSDSDNGDGDNGDSDNGDSDNESTGTVEVQDETNMPDENWDNKLKDDKENKTSDENVCPSSVPPCNRTNKTATTPTSTTNDSSMDDVCPLSMSSRECIKMIALHALPAILLGVFFAIALAAMCAVALYLAYRRGSRCCNGSKMRGLSKKAKQAKSNMHSLLGPSHQGFVKVKTFDSDTEEEDVIFQQF